MFDRDKNFSEFLNGTKLIGDEFSLEEITEWYNDEKEGYSSLISIDLKDNIYPYHALNEFHCFKYLPKEIKFNRVLGLGSALGHEFEPLAGKIDELTIIEPSDGLKANNIAGLRPKYIVPTINGSIDFPDNTFDLITSFGVLHHIPNVTFVLNELLRVLTSGGFLLLREPIVSMGDWRQPRFGLTKRERGIPIHIFESIFLNNTEISVVNRSYLTCMTSFIQSKFGFIAKKKLVSYYPYIIIDKLMATLLAWNIRYHHVEFHHKLAPQNVAYVISKLS